MLHGEFSFSVRLRRAGCIWICSYIAPCKEQCKEIYWGTSDLFDPRSQEDFPGGLRRNFWWSEMAAHLGLEPRSSCYAHPSPGKVKLRQLSLQQKVKLQNTRFPSWSFKEDFMYLNTCPTFHFSRKYFKQCQLWLQSVSENFVSIYFQPCLLAMFHYLLSVLSCYQWNEEIWL